MTTSDREPNAEQGEPQSSDSLLSFARALVAGIERVWPHLVEVWPRIAEAAAVIGPWYRDRPTGVGRAGLVVPLSHMTFGDMGELVRAYSEGGEEATIAFVRSYYDRLFERPGFLLQLKERWAADAALGRRIEPLAQALDAHQAGLFAVSVPTLLAQLEGLIADLKKHKRRMKEGEWREYMRALAGEDHFAGPIIVSLIDDVLAARFGHGDVVSSPLSRHAILHGGDVAYGTETNSRTAILLVDYFAYVSTLGQSVPIAAGADPQDVD
jgi:hypothetical protein